MEGEELVALQQQYEQLHSSVSELTKAVLAVVENLNKAATEKAELTQKQMQEEAEAKMFKRFIKMLKEEGAVFARKQGSVPSAHTTQTGAKPEKEPKSQQEPIQGSLEEKQVPRDDEEEEERRRRGAPEAAIAVKKAEEEEPEEDEKEKLKKTVDTLTKEVEDLKASVPKLVAKGMQEHGWKPVGTASVRKAGAEEVTILKSEAPVKKEELIKTLGKLPLGQLNDMHQAFLRGEIKLPEVRD